MNQYLEEERVEGFGGWFAVYLISLIAGAVALGDMILSNISQLSEYGGVTSASIYIVVALGVLFLILLLVSIGKKLTMTKAFGITVSFYFLCINVIGLIYFEDKKLINVLVTTILAIIWMSYLGRSSRVANTFTTRYQTLGRRFLTGLFIALFAMLVVIHIVLVVLVTGVWPTILTLILPVISEIYWFIMFWINTGFLNPFTSVLILYVLGIVIPFLFMLLYAPNQD